MGLLDNLNPITSAVDTGVNAVGNAAQQQTQDTTTANVGPAFNQPQIQQTAQEIPQTTQAAQTAAQSAGATEQKLAVPTGSAIEGAGLKVQKSALNQVQQTQQNYQNAAAAVNKSAVDVENQLQATNQAAQIDPDNYVKNMGVGQKTITALGMALSGIGSGLTGQPNLAFQALQTNINRDIAAQQQNFMNQSNILSQQRGVLQTAQDRQQMAANAYNMAVISVTTGAQTALQGLQTKLGGAVAPDKAVLLNNQLQLQKSAAQNQIDSTHVQTIQSQDARKINGLGMIYDGGAKVLGGKGIITDTSANQRVQQNTTQPTPVSGLQQILQNESANRNQTAQKPNFLLKYSDINK